MSTLKLYMIMLGATPPGRHTEQHDVFFGVAASLKDLVPEMRSFWPDAGDSLHVDAWREVTSVDGYTIAVDEATALTQLKQQQLFFINLGGYQRGLFDERHFKIVTVQADKGLAVKHAKDTLFYKEVKFAGAHSHIDDHYGLDVDDIYNVADILPATTKAKYRLSITEGANNADELHLGYFKLNSLS